MWSLRPNLLSGHTAPSSPVSVFNVGVNDQHPVLLDRRSHVVCGGYRVDDDAASSGRLSVL